MHRISNISYYSIQKAPALHGGFSFETYETDRIRLLSFLDDSLCGREACDGYAER